MSDTRINHCLELCGKANDLSGEALSQTLNELRQELQALRHLNADNISASQHPESNPEWAHEPVITMDMAGYLTGWNQGAQDLFGYTHTEGGFTFQVHHR